MHSLETELRELQSAGVVDQHTLARAVDVERGTVFSLYPELRTALYLAALLIATGIGILVQHHLNRLGPATLLAGLVVASGGCYIAPIRSWIRGEPRSLPGDYLLLLGALLLSTAVGYGEYKYHWLGDYWSWQLLLLAIVHAATAYWLNSRLVLTVALTSLAAWLGVDTRFGNAWVVRRLGGDWSPAFASRALSVAGLTLIWRFIHTRLHQPERPFTGVFDQFIAQLALWAALALCVSDYYLWLGAALLAPFTLVAVLYGLRTSQESFVVYGVGYGAVGLCIVGGRAMQDLLGMLILILAVMIGAAGLLWTLHGKLKQNAQ